MINAFILATNLIVFAVKKQTRRCCTTSDRWGTSNSTILVKKTFQDFSLD